jgi:hypothetical protein
VGRAQEDDPLGTLTRFGIVTLVVAAAAVLAVILLARGRGEAGGGVSSSGPVRVAATLDHRSVDFGDPVTAEVSVVVSQPGVRASDVSVREDLAPLTQLGGTRVTRTARGGRLVLTYTARASCLDERCIGGRAGKRIVLAPVVVQVKPGTTKAARWPALVVHTRVPAADVVKPVPPLRRDPTPRPVGYRVAPGSLALALEVAAAVRSPAKRSGGRRPTGGARSACSRASSARGSRGSRTPPTSSRGRHRRRRRASCPTSSPGSSGR